MSTLSFWLMLLIERRVGLTARHVAHSLLMRVMSAWLYIVEWWPELRRDNDCMVLGPQQTILTQRQYSDWHWLETDLKSIQHGSDWCHVDWVCCVESMLSLAVRCLRSAVPARPQGQLSVVTVSILVSDGVSQRVTGRGAASSDILSDLCSLRWLTHRPRQPRELHLNSCHPTLKSDTLRHEQQWPPVPRDCPWLKMGRRKQIVPKKSDNLDDQDPSKAAKNDEG